MRHETGALVGQGGLRLFTQSWLPGAEPRGAVVLAHGLAEHSGRYEGLVRLLTGRGFAVHALDHRGHGRSDGRRAYVDSVDAVVADLGALVATAGASHPNCRITLLGHSFGGAVAILLALKRPDLIGHLILSAAAVAADPDIPPLRLLLGRVLSRIAPTVGVLTLPAAAISRDPAVVLAYERDPLVYRGSIPARTAVELLAAMDRIGARVATLAVPALVMHGTDDALVPLRFAREVYARLPATSSVREYQGLAHEIFNEPERAVVFSDLCQWLDAAR